MRNDLLWLTAYAGCMTSMILILGAIGAVPARGVFPSISGGALAASVFLVQGTTTAQIQSQYDTMGTTHSILAVSAATTSSRKIRILIVPGHQPDSGGTVFGKVNERDVAVDIANSLATLLSLNPHYDVMVSRTKTEWNPILQTYIDTHALEILAFENSQSQLMRQHLADGSIVPEADQVDHNSTEPYPRMQLYGINKWANDNGYDITLHIHINDYARPRHRVAGKYDGFAVYVPDAQYSNAAESKAVGEAIAARLHAYHATSTLPIEDQGVVPDQELIAIGTNNSANNAALLIEYGYIYEDQFQKPLVRPVAVADYAYQTYLGLQDFFKDSVEPTYGSVSFPFDWTQVAGRRNESGPGVYALQAAMHHLGFYPPAGKSFSDCPVSGVFGPCTRSALKSYQTATGIEATGTVGPKTRAALSRDTPRPLKFPNTL